MAEIETQTKTKSALKPRITEKAALSADKNKIYVFSVPKSADKRSVATWVKETYKVTPTKINIAKIPDETISSRGRRGMVGRFGKKRGGKKAYVHLKEGDKIEIV